MFVPRGRQSTASENLLIFSGFFDVTHHRNHPSQNHPFGIATPLDKSVTMRPSILLLVLLAGGAAAFAPQSSRTHHLSQQRWERTSAEEYAALQDDDDEEEEETPPGQMRESEIKAELELRGISFADCFDKESLAERLTEARSTGKANPDIIDKFNRQKIEETFKEDKGEINDDDINAAVANDGTLPGGLTPDQFKKLTGDPEIMTLLQSTKMQDAMKLMMTGGREELEQKIKEDPELQETIAKLNTIMGGL